MRSRMIYIAAGIVSASLLPALIPLSGCALIAVILALCSIKWGLTRLSSLFCFSFGFLYLSIWGHWNLSERLPHELARTDWTVQGQIEKITVRTSGNISLQLAVEEIEPLSPSKSSSIQVNRLLLNWYKPDPAQLLHLKEGDWITAVSRLKPPHGLMNPSGFDYERRLLNQGVDATGYIRRFIGQQERGTGLVSSVRNSSRATISSWHLDEKNTQLFNAVITGDKDQLTEQQWESLRRSGTIHLAVISGLHIGFVALVGWWLGRIMGLIIQPFSYELPFLLSIVFSGSYLFISGADLPAQRAFIMISVLMLSGWRTFFVDKWTRWWMAIVAVMLISPLAIFESGFWLSFTAVALLIYLSEHNSGWMSLVKLQVWLLIGMLPLYLLFFSGISLVAPLINLLVIPLFSIMVPLIFLQLLLSQFDISLLQPVLIEMGDLFWWLVNYCSELEWVFLSVRSPDLLGLICVGVASLLVVLRIKTFSFALVGVLILPVILGVRVISTSSDVMEAWVYDVGQGLGVLVKVQDYTLIYDLGPKYRSGSSAFDRSMKPHLQALDIQFVDDLILSHSDNDHVGGFDSLRKIVDVGNIHASYREEGITSRRCRAGQSWQVHGVNFRMLDGSMGREDNDRSCVLQIEANGCRLLLPGDISAYKEKQISRNTAQQIHWLVASHHGSRSSTSGDFLEAFRPAAVIFSSGYVNHYGHPHSEVVERVRNTGAKIFHTGNEGAIILKATKENGCITKTMRKDVKRFWRSFISM